MAASDDILTIAYLNIRGQSGLPIVKQLQIEAFAKSNNCDIIHLQEAHIESETFSTCDFIGSTYNIIENNSTNKYGTASLVKSELTFQNIRNQVFHGQRPPNVIIPYPFITFWLECVAKTLKSHVKKSSGYAFQPKSDKGISVK